MSTRLAALLDKEWTDALKNRYILFLALFLPLIFVMLPAVMLYVFGSLIPIADLESELQNLPPGWQNPAWRGMTPLEMMQTALTSQFTVLYLIVPLAVPMSIATYSIIGEKRERSLEPLLATPITVPELLLGKTLAAAAPGIVISWTSALLFAIVARFLVVSERVYNTLFDTTYILVIILLAPLLTVLATTIGLMVSSRVDDPRAAEQLGMLVILPVLALFFGQISGVLLLDTRLVLVCAIALAAVDAGLLALAAGLFQRETILTRWK